jgi:hypothetical protein
MLFVSTVIMRGKGKQHRRREQVRTKMFQTIRVDPGVWRLAISHPSICMVTVKDV